MSAAVARTLPEATGTCRIVAGDAVATICDAWASAAARSEVDNVFFHPGFAIPAMNHIGQGSVSVALTSDECGALAAAPFTRTRLGRIAPAIRLWGHKFAPLGMPLIVGRDTESGLASLIDGLAPAGSGLSLILPDIETDGAVSAALKAIAAASGRPLAMLDDHLRAMMTRADAAILRKNMAAGHRKSLRRMLRRLGDLGEISFEVAETPDRIGVRLEEFLALELAGWKGKRGTALASTPATTAFVREAVQGLAAARRVRIHSLRLDDRPIAVVVSFLAGATAYAWKIAHDETQARYSPGVQLMLQVPEQLFADPAIMRIDSCAGADHAMIERLWPTRLGIASFVLGPPGGGAVHAVGLAAARAELAARASARQILNRR